LMRRRAISSVPARGRTPTRASPPISEELLRWLRANATDEDWRNCAALSMWLAQTGLSVDDASRIAMATVVTAHENGDSSAVARKMISNAAATVDPQLAPMLDSVALRLRSNVFESTAAAPVPRVGPPAPPAALNAPLPPELVAKVAAMSDEEYFYAVYVEPE